jgi:sporulation protein YlmC with PRC-barrel domain
MDNPIYLSIDTIRNTKVVDESGTHIGNIEDLRIDRENNRIAYAVLSFGSHLLGIGNKYFAMPLEAFKHDQHEDDGVFQYADDYTLNVDKAVLEEAEGIDRNTSLTQAELSKIYVHYGLKPYWEK